MKNLIVVFAFTMSISLQAQNVGIGTNNPQQKLHVAGGVRIDGLAGAAGIVNNTVDGDMSVLPFSGNINHVLLGNGTWGTPNGTVPAGSIVASPSENDVALQEAGFRLLGYIPGFSMYNTANTTPAPNTWRTTYVEGVPSKYSPPTADVNNIIFWVDSVMYLFASNQFYIYNPVSDTWRPGPTNSSALTVSSGCKMVYTGTELIVWGGVYTTATNNGFRYNPTTNVFTAIPAAGQPTARTDFGMAYVNNRVVVWGGFINATGLLSNNGAVLNLATNTWSAITATGAPAARMDFTCVANTTANNVIIWGGHSAPNTFAMADDGAIYNPVANTWTAMSAVGAPEGRGDAVAVWSGTEMIVHGGIIGATTAERYRNDGGRYNPATNTWAPMSTVGSPPREAHAAAWTGSRMLVSGGANNPFNQVVPFYSEAYTYDPATNAWETAGVMGVMKGAHKLITTNGDIVIAFGGVTTVTNAVSGNFVSAVIPRGSRYFINSVATSQTAINNANKLYLYIKL